MLIQKSFKNDRKTLNIVPTPIGNLEDITIRSINTLAKSTYILCEDTRNTGILLKKYDIKVPMKSYHEHNKDNFEKKLLQLFEEGNEISLVSDAGMPGISDPGFELIKFCSDNDINVVVLPGASAFVLGAVRSTFGNSEFRYLGFLKGSKTEKKAKIESIISDDIMSIIYESTHKLIKTIETIVEINPDYEICVCRELTKINEEYAIGKASEVLEFYNNSVTKGEYVIVFSGKVINHVVSTIEEEFDICMGKGMSKKEAIKQIAKNRNMKKNDVYMQFLEK